VFSLSFFFSFSFFSFCIFSFQIFLNKFEVWSWMWDLPRVWELRLVLCGLLRINHETLDIYSEVCVGREKNCMEEIGSQKEREWCVNGGGVDIRLAAEPVDHPVDRCVQSKGRLTARSTGMHKCVQDSSVDCSRRRVDRPVDRMTWWDSRLNTVDRPVDQVLGRSTARSTDRRTRTRICLSFLDSDLISESEKNSTGFPIFLGLFGYK